MQNVKVYYMPDSNDAFVKENDVDVIIKVFLCLSPYLIVLTFYIIRFHSEKFIIIILKNL